MNKRSISLGALLVALVLLVSVNVLARVGMRSARFDLTENSLYTLAPGTRNVLADLEEPITLRLYFSRKAASDLAFLQAYAQRIQELLEEYVSESSGKLTLEVIEPEPFSEEEDRAVGYGLQGATLQNGDKLYFGLVGTNSVDDERSIPFFDSQREQFLEYDLTELVYDLSHLDKKVVAVMSSLPLQGEMTDPRRPPRPWVILQQMEQLFEVRQLDPSTTTEIEDDVDVLMLVHPKALSDELRYAIDQYVLGGGKVLLFVDPLCEVDPGEAEGGNPMFADRSSNLADLMKAWGVELVPSKLAADKDLAQRVNARSGPVDYVVWLSLREDQLSADDFVTAQLEQINLASAGILHAVDGATTSVEPLMQTTTEAMAVDAMQVQMGPDPERLLDTYFAEGQKLMLAARISGPAHSAFPDGRPGGEPEDSADEAGDEPSEGVSAPDADTADGAADDADDDAAGGAKASHLAEADSIQVIVVADADILHERLWARVQDFLGQALVMPIADNGEFVSNCLDNLCGSNDLISLRGRGGYQRPFEKKIELEREADARFRAEEQALEAKLREAETRLTELQQQKDGSSALILSDEQVAEIERFQQERLETRKQLREVQHQLRKDIESLGTWLKLANVLLVPAVLGLGALGLTALRSGRRS